MKRSFYFVRFKWLGDHYEAAVEVKDSSESFPASPEDLVRKIVDEAVSELALEEACYDEIEIVNISKIL